MHAIGTFCRVVFHMALVLVNARCKEGVDLLTELQQTLTKYMRQHISLASLTRTPNSPTGNIFSRVSSLRFILSHASNIFRGLVPAWFIPILEVMSNTVGIVYCNEDQTVINYLYTALLTTVSGVFTWNFAPHIAFGYRHLHELFSHFADLLKEYGIALFRMAEENGERRIAKDKRWLKTANRQSGYLREPVARDGASLLVRQKKFHEKEEADKRRLQNGITRGPGRPKAHGSESMFHFEQGFNPLEYLNLKIHKCFWSCKGVWTFLGMTKDMKEKMVDDDVAFQSKMNLKNIISMLFRFTAEGKSHLITVEIHNPSNSAHDTDRLPSMSDYSSAHDTDRMPSTSAYSSSSSSSSSSNSSSSSSSSSSSNSLSSTSRSSDMIEWINVCMFPGERCLNICCCDSVQTQSLTLKSFECFCDDNKQIINEIMSTSGRYPNAEPDYWRSKKGKKAKAAKAQDSKDKTGKPAEAKTASRGKTASRRRGDDEHIMSKDINDDEEEDEGDNDEDSDDCDDEGMVDCEENEDEGMVDCEENEDEGMDDSEENEDAQDSKHKTGRGRGKTVPQVGGSQPPARGKKTRGRKTARGGKTDRGGKTARGGKTTSRGRGDDENDNDSDDEGMVDCEESDWDDPISRDPFQDYLEKRSDAYQDDKKIELPKFILGGADEVRVIIGDISEDESGEEVDKDEKDEEDDDDDADWEDDDEEDNIQYPPGKYYFTDYIALKVDGKRPFMLALILGTPDTLKTKGPAQGWDMLVQWCELKDNSIADGEFNYVRCSKENYDTYLAKGIAIPKKATTGKLEVPYTEYIQVNCPGKTASKDAFDVLAYPVKLDGGVTGKKNINKTWMQGIIDKNPDYFKKKKVKLCD